MDKTTARRPAAPADFARFEAAAPGTTLSARIAALEGGSRGFLCVSGEAALALAVLASAGAGASVLYQRDSAPEITRWFEHGARALGVVAIPVDAHDPAKVADGLAKGARGLVAAQLSHTSLRELDVHALSWHCRAFAVPLCVDNTAVTPLLRRPLVAGADLVLHTQLGMLTADASAREALLVVRDDALAAGVQRVGQALGVLCDDVARELRLLEASASLGIRLEHAQRSARALVERIGKIERPLRVSAPSTGIAFAIHFPHADDAAQVFALLPAAVQRGQGSVVSTTARMDTSAERRGSAASGSRVYLRMGLEHVDELWAWLEPALRDVRGNALVAPYPAAP